MKKLFTTILCSMLLLAVSGCQHEDIWNELREHEQRIEQLEKRCRELNSNVEAIQAILTAIQENDYVTEIMKIMENGVEVGYSITFAKGGTVTIYHGTDGTDGVAPKVSIRKAQDGEYYWTADGEWMTDENGEMIPAVVADDPNGEYVTPQFRVADGKWYVSYDNGNTWRAIDQKNDGENFFQNVTYDQDYVYITLADGNIFKIPYKTDSKVVDLFIFMGQSNMSGFGGDATLAPEVPEGWAYEYKAISNPDRLVHLQEPFGLNEDNAQSGVSNTKRAGTLVSAFANAYYEKTRIPIIGVSCSRGSTDTEFWKPGGKPLEDAIKRHLAAEKWLKDNGYSVRNNYMIWLQGESDAALSAGQYKSNLIAITKEMICRTGISNCMIIRIGKKNPTDNSFNNVLQAQTELPREYKEFVLASTLAAGFPEEGLMSDGVHYNQEGYNLLGSDAGINTAFYANNGIEPYMYDPHYGNLYYPTTSYKSIFDIPDIEPEIPQGTVYYELNKNINADNELVDYPGRIAILDYFETNGQAINVTSSITSTFGKRYYNEDKQINGTYSNYTNSTYSRIVCVLNETGEELPPNAYDGEIITINGKTYILQQKAELEELKKISILAIGNSFSIDAMEYLYGILEDAGYEEIVLGNLKISSCSLEKHANNFQTNSASYTYYTNTSGTWNNVISYAPIEALEDEDWDYITMQQNSGNSGLSSSYEPYLSNLIDVVRDYCPRSELVWHMTWAYQGNSTHRDFSNYDNDQMTMYNAIVEAAQNVILNNSEIKKIIPNGTSVQNLRTSYIGDNLTRDGYHLSYDNGRYLAAMTFAKALTGCSLEEITYRPSSYTYSDKEIAAIIEAANNACSNPYKITTSSYPPESDIEDKDYLTASLTEIISWEGYDPDQYIQLDIQYSEHAFYKSSDAQYISTLITKDNSDRTNLSQYIATPIYNRNALPDGTLIVQRSGQQYRPEGWIALDECNTESTRPAEVKGNFTVVTNAWWSDWNYRAFNISKTNKPDLATGDIEDLKEGFGIFVPKTKVHNVNAPYDFAGKTAYFFGDSITYGYTRSGRATNGGYPGVFSEAVGLTHSNYGVSGSLFGTYNDLGRIGDKIKSKSLNCDFMFVAGGINDWQCGVSLDDFRHAVEEVCSYISSNYDGEVMFITPINHSGRVPIEEPVAEVQDYRDIITEIALKYDFSVIQGNLFDFPTEDSSEDFLTLVFCDNLHPTEYGYEFYAECLVEVLL